MTAAEAAPWPALAQMRIRFVAKEDRLFVLGQTQEGEEHAVWLTQRLARRLVPALFHWLRRFQGNVSLEEPMSTRLPGTAQVTAGTGPSSLAPDPQPQGASAAEVSRPALRAPLPWVAHEAQLAGGGERLMLTLRQGQQAGVCLPLTAPSIRQCLRTLRRAWQEAEWGADVWPTELGTPAPSAMGAPVTLH